MTFQDIEFAMTSASRNRIHLPVKSLTDEMFSAVDALMADRWYELGGMAGVERGYNLEQVSKINAYLVPHISTHDYLIGCVVEVITERGAKLKKHIRMEVKQETIVTILDQFFSAGAPGLAPRYRNYFQNKHEALKMECAA